MDATPSSGIAELGVFTTLHLGVLYERLAATYDTRTALELALGVRGVVNGLLDLPTDADAARAGMRALSERDFREALHDALDTWARERADTATRPSPSAMMSSLDIIMND